MRQIRHIGWERIEEIDVLGQRIMTAWRLYGRALLGTDTIPSGWHPVYVYDHEGD